jgi:hypothetical protein
MPSVGTNRGVVLKNFDVRISTRVKVDFMAVVIETGVNNE